jgi:hypothetical protein
LKIVLDEVKVLTVPIVGFLKSSLITAALKLGSMHQYADPYSSSEANGDYRAFSSSKILKHSLLIGFLARPLYMCGLPVTCVLTGGRSGSILAFSLLASVSLESSSEG